MKHVKHPYETFDHLNQWLAGLNIDQAIDSLCQLFPDVAVFAVNANQQIIFWNQAAQHLLGFNQAEILGQHCLTANRCAECMKSCGLKTQGTIRSEPLRLYRDDGRAVQVRKFAQSFRSESGEFAGGIEMLIAVSGQHQSHLTDSPQTTENDQDFFGILSRSELMQQVFQVIRNTAQTEATVLVRGESGTGKELVAHALHTLSQRHQGPFMAINCATLSTTLLESELFGHVRGAFTGAIKDHPGLLRSADHGTVFLDEIAELPLELQAKLLRFLQERSLTPVGGHQSVHVNVRIIAATHRSLREEVKAGRFREDLMYRLRVVPIFLPPLRERREDIELLLWHFITQHNQTGLRQINQINPDVMHLLDQYHWPGNIRELQNVIEYAFAVGRSDTLTMRDLPPEFHEPESSPDTQPINDTASPDTQTLDEAQLIRSALQQHQGNINRAAAELGMSRATFWRKRKRLGL
ncbi:MAG: sigma 54-interacting transcriptional regulator [Gammaproteobacteria bacterium]|nr:sigma 54-interacting transcriptional regulator [Gammaproteobacteria bacterium]